MSQSIAAEYVAIRERHQNRSNETKRLTLAEARANAFRIDWTAYTPPVPAFIGLKAFHDYPLAELAERIDWTPFFQAWELHGRYPKILDDAVVGDEAKKLFADAQAMLKQIIAENWLEARAVIGLFPANRVGDDIEIYTDETAARWR